MALLHHSCYWHAHLRRVCRALGAGVSLKDFDVDTQVRSAVA